MWYFNWGNFGDSLYLLWNWRRMILHSLISRRMMSWIWLRSVKKVISLFPQCNTNRYLYKNVTFFSLLFNHNWQLNNAGGYQEITETQLIHQVPITAVLITLKISSNIENVLCNFILALLASPLHRLNTDFRLFIIPVYIHISQHIQSPVFNFAEELFSYFQHMPPLKRWKPPPCQLL